MKNIKTAIAEATLQDAINWFNTSEQTIFVADYLEASVNHPKFDINMNKLEDHFEMLLHTQTQITVY